MKRFIGIVQKGSKRGKALGYPTANIELKDDAVFGIYAARAYIKEGETPYIAAAFADSVRKILEVYLLDFDDDLYGQKITVELHKKIRETEEFPDDAALRAAIADDIAKVREYFRI